MVAKVSISIVDPTLLAWAKEQAEREGTSLSAVFAEALRRDRQREARMRVEKWLGAAGELTPEREAELVAEWGEVSVPVESPTDLTHRRKRSVRKRSRR